MGVDIRVGGVPEWNAAGVTVSEDSTPLDPSDNFGGVGEVSFTIPDTARAKSLLNATVEVTDSNRGTVTATVKAIASRKDDLSHVDVAAISPLGALVAKRTALPHVGTLESLVTYYFELCGITTGFTVDAAIADTAIVAPGWYGNVWVQLKKLCSAYQIEVALVGGDIVVRPPRSVTASRVSEAKFAWGLDESDLAQTVGAWFYEVAEITDALVVGNELSAVSNIDAGEVLEFDVPLDASLSSVVQPVAVDSVGFADVDASEYSVLDNTDSPVSAAAWTAGGGRVSVEISEDTRSLRVTVVGSQNRFLAPYRLAGFAISGAEYSTLRIIGTGVSVSRGRYVLPACTDDRAGDELGADVDNEFFGSWGHAHLAMLPAARRAGGVSRRLSGVARVDESFGNVAGARVFEDFNVYRIRPATMQPPSLDVGYTAEVDLIFADTNAVNSGHTIAQWNAQWAGQPISEYNLCPLTPIEGEVTPPVEGLFPGSLTFPSSTTFPGA